MIYLLDSFIYSFVYFILSSMLTITEQILFIIKNSNKMLTDVNTLVKKAIKCKIKKKKIFLLKFSYIILQYNKIHKSDDNINTRRNNFLKKS